MLERDALVVHRARRDEQQRPVGRIPLVGGADGATGAVGARGRRRVRRRAGTDDYAFGDVGAVETGVGRRQPNELGPDLFVRLDAQALAQLRREIGGDDPIGAGRARRRDQLRDRADAPFEVGERAVDLGRTGRRQHHVGVRRRCIDEEVDGDHAVDPFERATGEIGVGEVGQRVGPQEHESRDASVGRRFEDAAGIETALRRQARPFVAQIGGGVGQGDASGQHAGRQTHVERAVHVAAPQRRQEAGTGHALTQFDRGVGDDLGRFGERGPADDHRHGGRACERRARGVDRTRVDTGNRTRRRVGGDEGARQRVGFTRPRMQAVLRVGRQPRRSRRELDERDAVVDDGVAQPQVERAQLFFGIRAQEDDHAALRAGVVDRGPRQRKQQLGRQTVTELAIDVVGADQTLRELGPRVGRFVGEPRPAEHPEPLGPGGADRFGGGAQCLAPRRSHELWAIGLHVAEAVAAHQRLGEPALTVERFEAEPLLVGEPSPVDRVVVDTEVAQHDVA